MKITESLCAAQPGKWTTSLTGRALPKLVVFFDGLPFLKTCRMRTLLVGHSDWVGGGCLAAGKDSSDYSGCTGTLREGVSLR
jgi:hypothetical protein